jgi:hypothetical protein
MAAPRPADEHAREPAETDRAPAQLRRRGLVAGAAALVAAALATRIAQPVGATQLVGTNNFNGALDTNADGVQGYAAGTNAGVFGRNNDFNGVGVSGVAPSGIGVSGASANGPGVSGTSTSNIGVFGQSGNVGVYGDATVGAGNGTGVQGVTTSGNGVVGVNSGSGGNGVYGGSTSSTGVAGISQSWYGVYGQSNNNHGTVGVSNSDLGVYGQSNSGFGVYGYSTSGHGVIGNTGGIYGVVGFCGPGTGGAGIMGYATTPGGIALGATAISPATTAANLSGNVFINGSLTINGAKSAAVPHPDGSHRLLYCLESPENFFVEFGDAALAGGKVTIPLDRDFAALVSTTGYRVLLTPTGDCNGLYVSAHTPSGFTVQEAKGGTSSVGFAYCVVAARKDIAPGRLAKVSFPAQADITVAQPADVTDRNAKPGPPKAIPGGASRPPLPGVAVAGSAPTTPNTAQAATSAPSPTPGATSTVTGTATRTPTAAPSASSTSMATATATTGTGGTGTPTGPVPNPVATPRS